MRMKSVRNLRREHRLADTAQTCRNGFRVSTHRHFGMVRSSYQNAFRKNKSRNGESARVFSGANTSGMATYQNSPHLAMAASKLAKRNVPHFSP